MDEHQDNQQLQDEKESGAYKALQSEREITKNLKKQLKELTQKLEETEGKYNGIDPEEYKTLLEEKKQKEISELEQRKEFEKSATMKQEEIDRLKKEIQSNQQSYQELKKQSALQRAYFRARGKDIQDSLTGGSYFQMFYQQFGNRFQLNEDGSLLVLDDQGREAYNPETAKNVTVEEYLNSIKQNDFYGRMFEAEPTRSGTGQTVNGNGKGNGRPSFEEKFLV